MMTEPITERVASVCRSVADERQDCRLVSAQDIVYLYYQLIVSSVNK